jgi:hypothetical protein
MWTKYVVMYLFPMLSLTAYGDCSYTPTAAQKIFESDFGGSVAMVMPNLNSTNGWWPIGGGDHGFNWPISLNGGSSRGLQPISYGPTISYDPSSAEIDCGGSSCWKAEIIRGTRHDGTTGPIFHQANYQNIHWQFPYIIAPGADVSDEYQMMWFMLPSDLAAQMGPNSWRAIWEWKDAGYQGSCPIRGYRIAVFVMTNNKGNPYWDIHGDNCPQGPFYWDKTSHVTVPVGQWMKLEWAWHRTHDSTSWTWVKLNGVEIMRQNGGGTSANGFYTIDSPIDRIMLFQMYGAQGASEQWADHVEIWDTVPYSMSRRG